MFDFLDDHKTLFIWLTGASVVIFLGSLIVAPIIIVRLPADYFAHDKRPESKWRSGHSALGLALKIGRNIIAVFFILTGLAMLVLPGQGVLMLLLGVMLIDYPGKYKLQRWLVRRPGVLKALNWIRRKGKREEFTMDAPAA